jgi:ABC-type branched-subunit amino acid transport system ATPase component
MKLSNLEIIGFRRFERYRLNNLGQVNLLVGTNNCGKTTVLEAVSILMANGDLTTIWSTLTERGEEIFGDQDPTTAGTWQIPDVRRLFRGHEIEAGKQLRLSADTDRGNVTIIVGINEYRPDLHQFVGAEPRFIEPPEEFLPSLTLSLHWSDGPGKEINLPISSRGGVSFEAFRRNLRHSSNIERVPIQLITAAAISPEVISSLFEEIVLTPEEELVTDALRIIEPKIERIASSGAEKIRGTRGTIRYSPRGNSPRGGILVRLKGVKDSRIPIGSMGDGIWRILGLALSLVRSAGGILLVDEIDTGLHHTVMQKMWRFLYEAAKRYNVQVIATTHSWDCYHSLAVICRDEVSDGSEVIINRIESGREEAVSYTEQEIIAAAELDIEVR